MSELLLPSMDSQTLQKSREEEYKRLDPHVIGIVDSYFVKKVDIHHSEENKEQVSSLLNLIHSTVKSSLSTTSFCPSLS